MQIFGAAENHVAARSGRIGLGNASARSTLSLDLTAAQFDEQLEFLVRRSNGWGHVKGGAGKEALSIRQSEYVGKVASERFVKRIVVPLKGVGGQEVTDGGTVDQPLAS